MNSNQGSQNSWPLSANIALPFYMVKLIYKAVVIHVKINKNERKNTLFKQ
jgi:hypothetical protein